MLVNSWNLITGMNSGRILLVNQGASLIGMLITVKVYKTAKAAQTAKLNNPCSYFAVTKPAIIAAGTQIRSAGSSLRNGSVTLCRIRIPASIPQAASEKNIPASSPYKTPRFVRLREKLLFILQVYLNSPPLTA